MIKSNVIFYHGKIIMLDKNNSKVAAIVLTGGLVSATESEQDIHALAISAIKRIDLKLKDKHVIPGLNDFYLRLIRDSLTQHNESSEKLWRLSFKNPWAIGCGYFAY
ncbi:hypothetical protein [Nitrosomonas sp. Nm166]|uniref:hypothetical protein n=1 Tax=Nitrosomonas sp. Nm166 TaxID=1881054 RepID=UPI0008DFC77A|nr:hypothetical protein [Nitrosomonas sp. Nm166]SFE40124.1 hypothetical protein SAMN05428977_101524 [Nitrosomonas sp. Nm166]